MNKPLSAFYQQVRVYYEDTDAGGVVYHAKYLNFLERVRTDWLRAKGIEQKSLAEVEHIVFVITSLEIQYLKPAFLDDLLTIYLSPKKYRNASMDIMQRIFNNDILLVDATVKIACVNNKTLSPVRFPKHLKQEIMS